MTDLPSITCLLSTIVKSQASFSRNVVYLVEHVAAAAAPPTTISIVAPIRFLATQVDRSTYRAMSEFWILLSVGYDSITCPQIAASSKFYDERSDKVVGHCQRAREELVPVMEDILTNLEPHLISHLRYLDRMDRFLRFMREIPGFWSGRSDLDDLPDLISSVRSSCHIMMTCLDYVERYVCILRDCFRDRAWVTRHAGRPELQWCLLGTMASLRHTTSTLIQNGLT
ncbi:uncharacterized protein EV420DRAFT_1645473 [Desarmillaria tabescens]|uniref:Uncharacterized protein n=1 Tax=Armillaria tabescens TaxID=1929756 RepID=A0AA39K3U6_ARMTA|nr:uncharacterized protein EV420DRAFT_1645473 [Desarmillaria tabescens]KAK0452940.1 hypothetical protein EV420DRAFT_1645473 [Desarmillaria tabescens]